MHKRFGIGVATAALALGTWASAAMPAGASSIEHRDPTIHTMDVVRVNHAKAKPRPRSTTPNLTYRGGQISAAPRVFIVYWGAQWGAAGTDAAGRTTFGNDLLGVAPYQQAFLGAIRGTETWSRSTTQYCQGVAYGTINCGSNGTHVGHPDNSPLAGIFVDNAANAPSQPTQSQLAQEAVNAVTHFKNSLAGFDPASDQVIVSTFSHNNSSGFGTQYCAWHSSTSSSYGSIAYTNAPYIPDAGASCGANFVNKTNGALDGVSIVGGHEYAETITDMFPNGGWLDSGGAENADKCAWISSGTGYARNVTLGDGVAYPMQSLWSNTYNSNAGGCVMSYTSSTSQAG